MRKALFAVVVGLSLASCRSIDEAQVISSDVAANGEAIELMQASSIGFTLFLHNVVVVDSSLDQVVNKMLVAEAKAMGAHRVQLVSATTSPRNGIYALPAILVGFPSSQATGLILK